MTGTLKNIAIVSTNKNKYSETFIHNHIRMLPARIHFLYDGYLPQKYSTDHGLSEESFSNFNLPLIRRLFSTSKADFSEKELSQKIADYLLEHKIEAVLAEYGPSGVKIMNICESLNLPLIVHFHGYDAYRDDILSSYGKQYPELFRIADKIIAVSKDMYNQLIKLGCPEEKLHHLPYGIDHSVFHPLNKKTHAPIFISCGRFVPKKAPLLVINAFEKVIEKMPNAQLIMIGDGELLPLCKEQVKEAGLQHAIHFTGSLPQKEIAGFYQQAAVFVQHSVTTPENDSEGTPLAVLEAMYSGLPVVATRHGGIPDVVTDGVNGFLVNENDDDLMATKMIDLIENPEIAQQMGTRGVELVHEHYTLENYTSGLWNLINDSCINQE